MKYLQKILNKEKNTILDKKKLTAEIGAVTPKAQIDKLDDDAVIRVGETVEPGDILDRTPHMAQKLLNYRHFL